MLSDEFFVFFSEFLFVHGLELVSDRVSIEDFSAIFDVVGSTISVSYIIRVFSYVDSYEGDLSLTERVSGVAGVGDCEGSVRIFYESGSSRAEVIDGAEECSFRFIFFFWGLELVSVELVIERLSGVIVDGSCGCGFDDVFEGLVFEFCSRDEGIEFVDVGLVVFGVVVVKGFSVEDGFQCVHAVGEGWEGKHMEEG